jgi:hypothetical protein
MKSQLIRKKLQQINSQSSHQINIHTLALVCLTIFKILKYDFFIINR